MKVLVTGGNGFIGRYVVKAAQAAGHQVLTLDNVGPVDVPADITQPLHPIEGLDGVIHLAAFAHPTEFGRNPGLGYLVNVQGTQQVLKMAQESGAKRFVFSSSAHVYGIPPKYLPSDENHPLWLQNDYTLTKILGEQLCQLYHQNHGLSYAVLRLFNAYGPGQAPGYFIPDMLVKAQSGYLKLRGAETTKDFVYVEDVARAFVLALENSYVGVINIGSGIETSLGDVVAMLGYPYQAEGTDIPTRMQAEPSRALRVLGWEPTVSLEEGLRRVKMPIEVLA